MYIHLSSCGADTYKLIYKQTALDPIQALTYKDMTTECKRTIVHSSQFKWNRCLLAPVVFEEDPSLLVKTCSTNFN